MHVDIRGPKAYTNKRAGAEERTLRKRIENEEEK
jgi:hypothetical protein